MMNQITVTNVFYTLGSFQLDDINININPGEFISIIGGNGSGKSTLARLFNGLFIPSSGDVVVSGMNTKTIETQWEIKRRVGLVFQRPENGIVGSTVEEDIVFGLENLGLPKDEIEERLIDSLHLCGISNLRQASVNQLSAGFLQKEAICAVLSMSPECIILDESTSTLDRYSRTEIIQLLRKINSEKGTTIILITQFSQEALQTERTILMNRGKIVADDIPSKIYSNISLLESSGVDIPQMTRLFHSIFQKTGRAIAPIHSVNDAILYLHSAISTGGRHANLR